MNSDDTEKTLKEFIRNKVDLLKKRGVRVAITRRFYPAIGATEWGLIIDNYLGEFPFYTLDTLNAYLGDYIESFKLGAE